MTGAGSATSASRGRPLALIGAIATIAVTIVGIALGAWPIEGIAIVVLIGAVVVIGAGFLGRDDGLPAELALTAATTIVLLAIVQALQGVTSLSTPARGIDALEVGLAVILALAVIVTLVGVTGRRVLGRLLGDPWRGASGVARFVVAAGLLEFVAWLILIGLSGGFGIGFTPPAQVRYDPLPAYGLAGASLAVLMVRWSSPALDVRLRVPAAWLAVVPALVAGWAGVTLFGQFQDVNAAFPGRFNELDTISFNLHFVAVALIVVGVVIEAGLAARRRISGTGRGAA